MILTLHDTDEILFVGALFLFYTHWLNDRRTSATEALEDAVAAHRSMGDDRANQLAQQVQGLIQFAITSEQQDHGQEA